ncbi:MAG: M28 family peptidase [Planctomycetota bacterium]|jgi:hypothetical protein
MKKLYRDRLEEDVLAISFDDGRLPGSEGHRLAREYIIERMGELGLEPYGAEGFELPYRAVGEDFVNIVGVVRSGKTDKKPVLIGSHYDSVIDAPCADDNASAVAISLSAAKILSGTDLARDVIIAIFDAEEPPHFRQETMGSIRFYKDQMNAEGLHAAIVMDLVGHDVMTPSELLDSVPVFGQLAKRLCRGDSEDVALPIIRDLFFLTGVESHPAMPHIVGSVKAPAKLRPVCTLNKYIGDISDHGIFRVNHVPYLFMSCGRWRHYHSPTDTPKRLNYAKMERIMRYLVAVTDAVSRDELDGESPGDNDTSAFEIRTLKEALGPILPILLKALGVKKMETRQDIDKLAEGLLSLGL